MRLFVPVPVPILREDRLARSGGPLRVRQAVRPPPVAGAHPRDCAMTAAVLDLAAIGGALLCGAAILDLWRRDERWAAIGMSLSAWVILLVWALVLLR